MPERDPDGRADATWSGATPETAPGRADAPDDATEEGPYELGPELARGGLGRILVATDRRLRRTVALKLLLPGSKTNARRRFVREAEITAGLQHPGIVPVYDVGRRPDGTPYYTMRLVEGRTLEAVLDEAKGLDGRLALLPHLLTACDAVAYAHAKGVVHRDLKPANLIVGAFGETVVIDWGIAKRLEPGSADKKVDVELTRAGSVLGTPSYMAPEQALGAEVDARADVYALGVVLYQLLAGRVPFEGTADEVITAVTGSPPPPVEVVQPGAPRELVAVVRKAMARAPADRYPSARELAEDLKRFQTGQIVGAHAYSVGERARRFARRWAAPLATVAALALGLAGSTAAFVGRLDAARRAETARADELTVLQATVALDTDPTEALRWLSSLSDGAPQLARARVVAADALSRGVARVVRHDAGVGVVRFTPDGGSLLTVSDDGTVGVLDLRSNAFRKLAGHEGQVWALETAGGSRVVSGGQDGTVRVWDVATGQGRILARHTAGVLKVVVAGDRVVSTALDGSTAATTFDGGSTPLLPAGSPVIYDLRWSVRGALAAASSDGAVLVWDRLDAPPRRLLGHTEPVYSAVFSPDGSRIASASSDRTARLWDVAMGEGRVLAGHEAGVWPVAFSADGRWLATPSADRTIRIWDVATGACAKVLRGHDATVQSVEFAPDGRLVSGSADGTVRVWDLETGGHVVLRGHGSEVTDVAVSPDGARLASSDVVSTARLWAVPPTPDFRAPAEVVRLAVSPGGAVAALDAAGGVYRRGPGGWARARAGAAAEGAPDPAIGDLTFVAGFRPGRLAWAGDRLVATRADHALDLLAPSGEARTLAGHGASVSGLAVGPGDRLVTADLAGLGLVWDLARPDAPPVRLAGHEGAVLGVAVERDGTVLTGGRDGTLRRWRPEAGFAGEVVDRDDEIVSAVAVAGDVRISARRVLAFTDGAGATWTDAALGNQVTLLAVSDDGAQVVAGAVENRAFVHDLRTRTGRPLAGHGGRVTDADFAPDGSWVVTASEDHTLRLWDLTTDPPASRALHHDGAVLDVEVLPDGTILSAGADRTVRSWTDPVPRDPAALQAWLDAEVARLLGP